MIKKINETAPDKISGLTGDLTDMETQYIVKEFFEKTIKSKNLDCRPDYYYVENSHKSNYIFNPSINGIEESDLIILILLVSLKINNPSFVKSISYLSFDLYQKIFTLNKNLIQ